MPIILEIDASVSALEKEAYELSVGLAPTDLLALPTEGQSKGA